MLAKFVKYSIKKNLFCYASIVFLILYWSSAYSLPYKAIRYPLVISAIATVLIAANLIQSIRGFRKELQNERAQAQSEGAAAQDKARWDCTLGFDKKKIGVIAATLLYPLLLNVVGFFPLSLIYLAGVSWSLGIRNKIALPIYAVVLTVLLYLIFGVWLDVNLPMGLLFSRG